MTDEQIAWSKEQVFLFAIESAKKLGYEYSDDLWSVFKNLGGSLTSDSSKKYFTCHCNGNFEVNSSYCSTKFEIAKAIGHYILHARMGNPIVIPIGYVGRMEVEGNWFSARFLLTEPEFTEKWNSWKSNARLAVHFDVPESAIELVTKSMNKIKTTDEIEFCEKEAWYESGLSAHGCNLDDWNKDAIVRYGRILHQRLLTELHSLRMQNSGQAALIERYKDKIKMLLSPCGKK